MLLLALPFSLFWGVEDFFFLMCDIFEVDFEERGGMPFKFRGDYFFDFFSLSVVNSLIEK